jgi:hypothetical protein
LAHREIAAVPHERQNLALGGSLVAHFLQGTGKASPQAWQDFAASALSAAQRGHGR